MLPIRRRRIASGVLGGGSVDPYPGLVVYDSFTDTDAVALTSHTPEKMPSGAVWTALAGTMSIQSNRAQWATAAPCIQWIETGVSDTTLSCIVNATATSNSGIAFRVEGASDWLIATINPAPTNLVYVLKRNPGLVVVAQQAFAMVNGTNYVLEVVISGANITVSVDGVQKISTSDSHNQTITKHGFHCDGSVAAKFDEFQVTG